MNSLEQILNGLLLQKLEELFENIKNEKLRIICQAYAEQIIPNISKQLCNARLDFKDVPLVLPETVRQELDKVVLDTAFTIIDRVSLMLPEGNAKEYLASASKSIINNGYRAFVRNEDWQRTIKQELKDYGKSYAKDVSHKAIAKARALLPDNQYTAAICQDADTLAMDIIDEVAKETSLDAIYAMARERVLATAKTNAGGYAKERLNQSIDYAVECLADKARRKGRGQAHSRYNQRVNRYAEQFKDCLKENSAYAVDRILNGESYEEVLADFVKSSAQESAGAVLADGSREAANKLIKDGAKRLHVSGKGSRKINRHIDSTADIVSDSFTGHLGNNIIDVVNGDKAIDEAIKDTAIATAKDSARTYMEKHGAELAKEAIETITAKVAQKMGNEATKQLVLKAGSSLANANTITAIAGGIYDVGKSFKDFLDGKISKAELLRQIGEKGSSACLSSMGATYGGGIGFTVGGPVGAAIGAAVGSMVGYVASSMLYGSVLQAFENEEAARLRAEQTHAFCEAAIRRMRAERAEFERQAELLFKERQTAAIEGFRAMETAVINNDFDKFSASLNRITVAFGQKLQFTNFEEFDAFMESDEDFDL